MPILIRGSGGKSAKLQSDKIAESGANDVIYTPDDGYDGFLNFTVKAEKNICSRSSSTSVIDSGQSITVSCSVPLGLTADKMADDLFMVYLFAENQSQCSDVDLTYLSLLIKHTSGQLIGYELSYDTAKGYGGNSSLSSSWSFSGTITFDASTLKLTVKISNQNFTRTDGYGMRFSSTARYQAIVVYRGYPNS